MKISISPWYANKEGIAVDVGSAEVVCQQVYCGIGIIADGGTFGIAERDGVIEILHNGDLILDSDQIKALIEHKAQHQSRTCPKCKKMFCVCAKEEESKFHSVKLFAGDLHGPPADDK